MSTARHHAEWLSLTEISGPFLSMPVLLRVFPQGLDADDPDHRRELRAAYEEWRDNQFGLRPDPAIHHAWVRYVLQQTLEFPAECLASGQAIPPTLQVTIAEYGETIRPDLIITARQAAENAKEKQEDKKENLADFAPSRGTELLVIVVPAGQDLEKPLKDHHWKASPATRLVELLHATNIRLGLLTNGEQWMLVNAPRGETSGLASWYAELWFEENLTLRAFRSLLSVRRFFGVAEDETLAALLAQSADEQHEVTDQLGYQVRRAVEVLVQAIDLADRDAGRNLLAEISETELYEAALTVMMRLVFLFSAEERGLFPLDDELYAENYAAGTLREQLREAADQFGEEVIERRLDAWTRLLALFRAVHAGVAHDRLRLPAYGGSLFDPDRFPFLEGRPAGSGWRATPADPLPVNNRTVLHLLEALQLLQVAVPGGPAEARRLSFRALDIEQIGHVYEGLLDHTAVRATGVVLGLAGARDREPEISLEVLESSSRKDAKTQSERGNKNFADFAPLREKELIAYLKEQTGRSENALGKALHTSAPDSHRSQLIRAVCNNDESLYRRVLPWAGLIRDDDMGRPVVILPGSVYVTAGAERRATGTHYTPKSLTEPIVQHTLEPLVYTGPAEGLPQEQWRLKSPAELLNLKICDMAMGSGAFLVQTCRYLSERLVESWENVSREAAKNAKKKQIIEKENLADLATQRTSGVLGENEGSREAAKSQRKEDKNNKENLADLATWREILIAPEGMPTDNPDWAIPADTDDRLLLARRLIADRCLYGVDKNPLAVENG